ncbi:MAG: Na+-dependent transporter [Methanomassiliicoccaceae archaeon]|nr:Na+-dependent transporter [Methanomassiliicoccaceae archaeon]
MAAMNILSNMRVWIILGVICAFIVGPIGDISSTLIVIVLIIQMTLSMDGLSFNAKSLKENKGPISYSVIACFGISTAVTLVIGSFFIADHPEIWKGWVVLAAVPCAVSVVTMSFFSKGNTTMCVLSLAVIYFIALAMTPLITWALAGESVSVLRIFSYVVLFVAVPMAASVPLKKVKIGRDTRMIAISVMLFFVVLLSLGQNREYLFSEPGVVLLVAAACIIRVFAVSFAVLHFLKKKGTRRDDSMVYVPMAVWKNSGLGVTLCFVLFGSMTEAVIPCAISLLIELLWFAAITKYIERVWPDSADRSHPADG